MPEPDAPDEAVGLLERIADTALDADYYVVRAGPYSQSREFNTVLTAIVLAAFALLVTMAALQTRSDRPATERERESLVNDVAKRRQLLTSREGTAQRLRDQVSELRSSADRIDPDFEVLRVQAADRAATGPGVTMTVTPSSLDNDAGQITDTDLQILVNGLWYAGAEAVSVNGNRIGTLTSIRAAGPAILVNFRSIGPPYTVVALGNDETLASQFRDNPSGRYWTARSQSAGVRLGVSSSSELSVPAAPLRRVTIIHAQAIEGER